MRAGRPRAGSLPPVFTGRALLEAAAAGTSATIEGEAVRSGSAAGLQRVASKAAGGKPATRPVDRPDGQETMLHPGDDGQDGQEFTSGDLVEHKKFGRGVVTETLVGRGGDLEIFVHFETVGVKRLLVKFAPLTRL